MSETTTTNETAPPTPAAKPGHKTSEFYFKIAAIVLSAMFATNVIPTNSVWMKLAMIAALVLTSLGYTVSRTLVKTAAMFALIAFGLHTNAGCGASARETTIRATMTTLDAAQVGFLAYDQQHQAYIVAHAADEATGQAQLADYRQKRSTVERSFTAAYQAVATAALVNDDHSLTGLLAAAVQVKEALSSLGVMP